MKNLLTLSVLCLLVFGLTGLLSNSPNLANFALGQVQDPDPVPGQQEPGQGDQDPENRQDEQEPNQVPARPKGNQPDMSVEYNKLNAQARKILIHKGTERAWTGKYLHNKAKGTYICRRCNAPLYESSSKFESNCGWPSFDDEIKGAVRRELDSDGVRVEILCENCGGHLGHVFFGEGFTSKNTRHCVNSVSMNFVPANKPLPAVIRPKLSQGDAPGAKATTPAAADKKGTASDKEPSQEKSADPKAGDQSEGDGGKEGDDDQATGEEGNGGDNKDGAEN